MLDLAPCQTAPLFREEHVLETAVLHARLLVEAEHLRLVFSNVRCELLKVSIAGAGMGLHDDARFGTIDARLPRAFGADDRAVRRQFLRVLTEVPHVSLRIMGVPIKRVLDECVVLECPVVNDGAVDTQNAFDVSSDGDDIAGGHAILLAFVVERCSGLQWKESVVDVPYELRPCLRRRRWLLCTRNRDCDERHRD
ncbi:MAG: hypothetical protein DMF84_13165 [Acidobacteria bacterium]|nr:MAG: hypothetical protein DMF84_13165 [Acidobacteriota bacterium]